MTIGLPFLAAGLCAAQGMAQSAPVLPAEVLDSLKELRDFGFDFGQPGFYALLEYVKSPASPPLGPTNAPQIDDWSTLIERPGEFRGQPVTIEGVVGRNKSWRLPGEPYSRLGVVSQLELRKAKQPYACTVILTGEAADIPIDAVVRVSGYFCLVRQYRSESNQVCQAPLIVAAGPGAVTMPSDGRVSWVEVNPAKAAYWGVGLAVVLTATFLILRQRLRRGGTLALPEVKPAAFSVASEFGQWVRTGEGEQMPTSHSDEKSDAHGH